MPFAVNPQTGQVVEWTGNAWEPAREAVNPETGERMHFVEGQWRSLGGPQKPLQPLPPWQRQSWQAPRAPSAPVDELGLSEAPSAPTAPPRAGIEPPPPRPPPRPPSEPVDELGLAEDVTRAGISQQGVTASAIKAIPRGAIETGALVFEQPSLSRRQSQKLMDRLTKRIQGAKEASPVEFTGLLRELAKAPVPASVMAELINAAKDVRMGNVAAEDVDFRLEGNVAEAAMEGMRSFAERTFEIPEEHEQNLLVKVGRGVGSTTGFLASRVIGGLPALAAFAAGAGSGEAIERAAQNGADDATQARASLMGVVPGLTDMAPIERLFRPLVPVLQRYGPKALDSAKGAVYQVVASMVEQGVVEGTQEAIQQVMQNAIEQVTSRPETEITEGIAENGLVGFLVGTIFGVGAGAARVRRGRGGEPPAPGAPGAPRAGIEQETDLLTGKPIERPTAADMEADIMALVESGELTPEEADLILGEKTLTDEARDAAERLSAAAAPPPAGIEPLTPEQAAQAAQDVETLIQQGMMTPEEAAGAIGEQEAERPDEAVLEQPGPEEGAGEVPAEEGRPGVPESGREEVEAPVEEKPVKKKKRTKSEAATERYAKQREPNPKKDTLLQVVAKMGGIQWDDAESSGIDPAERHRRGWGTQRVFTKGGMSLEGMAQVLKDMQYTGVLDEQGNYSENTMMAALERSLRGEKLYSLHAETEQQQKQIEEYEDQVEQQFADEEYDDDFLPEDRSLTDIIAWAVGQGADEAHIDQVVEDAVFEGKSSAEIEAIVRKEVEAPTAGRPAPSPEVVEGEAAEPAEAEEAAEPVKEPKQLRVTPGIPRPSEFDVEASKRDRFELTPPAGKGARPKAPLLEKAKQHAYGDRWPWEMTAQEFIERREFAGKTIDEASDEQIATYLRGFFATAELAATHEGRDALEDYKAGREEAAEVAGDRKAGDREFARELLMEDAAMIREMVEQEGPMPVHARMIRDALKEGIEVSGEVLADYPAVAEAQQEAVEPGQVDLAGEPEGEQVAKVRQEQLRQEQIRRDREAAEKAEAAEAEPAPPLVAQADAKAAGQVDIEEAEPGTDPADLPEPPTLEATQRRRAKLKREASDLRKRRDEIKKFQEETGEQFEEGTDLAAGMRQNEIERIENRIKALVAEDEYQKFRQEAFEQEREAAKPAKPVAKADAYDFDVTYPEPTEAAIRELPRTPGEAIPLAEINVTMNVEVEGQQGTVEMEVPANEALAILDKRLETLAKIRSCVLK